MQIRGIETRQFLVPVDRGVGMPEDAKGFRFQSSILLVMILTDEEPTGIGEVNGSPDWSGETAEGARQIIEEHWAPQLVGEDPRRIRHCLTKLKRTFANPFARAGIEMALFDILGKTLNAPLYQLLGGACRNAELPLRFPVMPVDATASAAVASQMVSRGFETIKMKVGHDPLADDLKRLEAVREAIGSQVRLTVDANGGWTVNEAVQASTALEALDVLFVEQPVHRLDLEGLAEVRRRTRLPIMADESVFTVQDALRCIQLRAADIISVYPGKNGGILETMTIVGAAEAAGISCAIGSNLEWDVASAALAHLCRALPNIAVERYGTDIIGPLFHTQRAIQPPLLTSPAYVTVPDSPGLGIDLAAL